MVPTPAMSKPLERSEKQTRRAAAPRIDGNPYFICMLNTLQNFNTLWASVFVDELARNGIRYAVIAPGSRSTPLVMALAAHPDIADVSVLDERSASFFALGIAKSTGNPVAVVCTSGTAAANMHAAVCEADQSCVPVLVLTADRPVQLRDAGAPQTMNQLHLYGNSVRWFHDMAQPEADEEKLRYVRSTACHAVSKASGPPAGPVHLNFPFHKPLEPTLVEHEYATALAVSSRAKSHGFRGRENGERYTERLAAMRSVDHGAVERIASIIRASRRIIAIAGPDAEGAAMRTAVSRFAESVRVPVFAEAASQLRYDPGKSRLVLGSSALLLRSARVRELVDADLIIRLGAAPTTKAMQSFVAEKSHVLQIAIHEGQRRYDPDHVMSMMIDAVPGMFLDALAAEFDTRPRSTSDERWIAALVHSDDTARAVLNRWTSSQLSASSDDTEGGADESGSSSQHQKPPDVSNAAEDSAQTPPLHPAIVYSLLEDLLPSDCAVFVSNSMPIRDLETFLPATTRPVDVFFNRGVNGIDGVLSTAAGMAYARRGKTLLLTGDLAFLHDLNGLGILGEARVDLTIVVVNNDGGEIFAQLPVADFEPPFSRHFRTGQHRDLAAAADLFRIGYMAARSPKEYRDAVTSAVTNGGVWIVEVRTAYELGRSQRRDVLDGIARQIESELPGPIDVEDAFTRSPSLAWTRLRAGDVTDDPLVLLHGFTRSSRSWERVARMCSGHRPIIAIDLMGHGRSPVPDDVSWYTLDAHTRLLENVFEDIGGARLHLAGYSMGGRAALSHAIMNPGRLASLTLISASPGIEDAMERMARRTEDDARAARIERDGLAAFIDEWMAGPMAASDADPSAIRAARADRITRVAGGLARSLRGMGQGAQPAFWDALPSLRIPVLIIAGSHDVKYVSIARRMHEAIPNSHLEIVPGAGHDVPAACPRELSGLISEFIGR